MHHGAGLRALMGSAKLPRELALDYRTADVDAADAAMLAYAVRLTLSPSEVGAADVEALREAGFEDAAVLDVCQVVAYYNYVNRLADGLGVELEPFWKEEDLIVTREEFEKHRGGLRASVLASPGSADGAGGPRGAEALDGGP